MNEFLKDVILIISGAIIGIIVNWIYEYFKIRKQKKNALIRLDQMLSTIRQAVDHGHDFKNKMDWCEELDALAYSDRKWLGKFYEPIKIIAWRIRDQSFDHERGR